MDVGNAITFSIRAACLRRPGQIHAQAIGRTQARPFADENDRKLGVDSLSNRIADRHPSLLNDKERVSLIWPIAEPPEYGLKQWRSVAMDGECGKTVGDNQGVRTRSGKQFERRVCIFVQLPAEIGAAQILFAIVSATLQQE